MCGAFQHDLVVSGLDWSPVTNLIVSCSHDRNGYVWTWDEAQNKWQHAAVILRCDSDVALRLSTVYGNAHFSLLCV